MRRKALCVAAFATFVGLASAQSAFAVSTSALETGALGASALNTSEQQTVSPPPIESVDPTAVSEVLKLQLHLTERRLAVYRGHSTASNRQTFCGGDGVIDLW